MLTPTDGMIITEDAIFQPGVYILPHGLTVAADGITLDGNGSIFIGQRRAGCGITVEGRRGVTIQNMTLLEYYHGIYAHDCLGLTLSGCQVTSTEEILPNTIFLDIWLPAARAAPGGILLWKVSDSLIFKNDLQHQFAGLLSYDCSHLTVQGNVANYCSGWGFHLFETSNCLFEANYADFCCRYEPRGPRLGHMGADAAGFLIVHRSCRNVFRGNFARLGGDGFFLAGLTPSFEPVGCDENLFESNDGSYSPNIAFEATFSRGNIYRDNYANHCNYGFWHGFSREHIIENNQIIGNRQAGIAVENGFGFRVRGNTFQHNGHGVLLWSKCIPGFAQAVPENDTSYDWAIEQNTFVGNNKAIRIIANQDHGIRPLKPSGEWGYPSPAPHDHTIRENLIEDNRIGIELSGVERTILAENTFRHNVETDVKEF